MEDPIVAADENIFLIIRIDIRRTLYGLIRQLRKIDDGVGDRPRRLAEIDDSYALIAYKPDIAGFVSRQIFYAGIMKNRLKEGRWNKPVWFIRIFIHSFLRRCHYLVVNNVNRIVEIGWQAFLNAIMRIGP